MQTRKLITYSLAAVLLAGPFLQGANAVPTTPTIYSPPYDLSANGLDITRWSKDPLTTGVYDTTPVAAAAFTYSAADNRATFTLPAGTFSIDPQDVLTLPAGATLKGAGMGQTILVLESGRTGTCLTLASNTTLRDLTIQGADAASTFGVKPATNATNVRVERVEFLDVDIGSQSGTIVCSGGIIKATSGGIATIDPTVVDSWRVRFFIATALTGNLNSFAFRFADTSNYLRLTIATSGSQFQTVIATTATSIGVGVSGVTPAQGDEVLVTVSGNSLTAQIYRAGVATGTAASATNATGAGLTPMGFRFADTTVGFSGLTVRRL